MPLQAFRVFLTDFALAYMPQTIWSASSYRSDVAIISREVAYEIE
jgi:hypothetical protein